MSKGGSRHGAGRPRFHQRIGETVGIDVRRLQRDGCLESPHTFSWQWSDGSTVDLHTTTRDVTLSYRNLFLDGWRDIHETVLLSRTNCHFGGFRPWFICPRCSRLALIIYLHGWPACRKCSGLVYESQSETEMVRSWNRTYRILQLLGQETAGQNDVLHRPKGMRHATFERFRDKLAREERCRGRVLALSAQRLLY